MNIVFIGHVDAGKSTLCGQILLQAGQVDLNELKKFEMEAKENNRESWYLAYIMDQGEEERARGKTVEVGKAFFQTKNKRYTIIDAPGHKNYVPNMIQGTSQADVGCLVISAKEGEFESGFEKNGQTREHALLAKSMGIRHLVILVNKMDETGWSRERYMHIIDTLKPFLEDAGYDCQTNVNWCPVSGLIGENITKNCASEASSWYKGDSLFEMLDGLSVPSRDPNGPLRIPIMDKIRDQGLFLTGKIEQGCIKVDYHCQISPIRKNFQITQILDSRDRSIYYAKAGENVKIKVRGLEDEDIKKGFMVTGVNEPCHITQEIEA
jgi:peptide chain release factor subunit 3